MINLVVSTFRDQRLLLGFQAVATKIGTRKEVMNDDDDEALAFEIISAPEALQNHSRHDRFFFIIIDRHLVLLRASLEKKSTGQILFHGSFGL